jgi:sortase A
MASGVKQEPIVASLSSRGTGSTGSPRTGAGGAGAEDSQHSQYSRHPRRNRVRRGIGFLLALIALALALDASYLHAKAWLAQLLLRDAWAQTRQLGGAHKPWPWADMHPVARLQVPTRGIDQIVLAGDSGRTLAFGPGWAESSAQPGAHGTPVISGHRDTHFAFLQALQAGDEIVLHGAEGEARYLVASTRIADARKETLRVGGEDALLLVTCWPFDAVVPGGPLRYVVRAERTDSRIAAITAR